MTIAWSKILASAFTTRCCVADLDRSVVFYTRLLGMKVKERHASEARKWVLSAMVARRASRSSN
jgi:hypothetical protein